MKRFASHLTAGVVLLLCGLILTSVVKGERRDLFPKMAHLRSGSEREWSDFPADAQGRGLVVPFESEANSQPWTIVLRRIDVKEGWQAKLNGRLLGRLFSDENDMQEVWEVPARGIRAGKNVFELEATSDRNDDIRVGELWLDTRPRSEVFSQAKVRLSATDVHGEAIPCRFTIVNSKGTLAALGAESNDQLAVRSGVVYSLNGQAEIGLAPGDYTVYCGRGFEYSLGKRQLQIKSGDNTQLAFQLRREVETPGLVAVDTHVHTFEVSRHGDASLVERMITLAGEGIEVAVATDHNVHVDYRPYLKRMGVDRHVTPIIGNEVTTKYGHFNVFPATAAAEPSNHRAENWEALFKSIYTTPNVRVAILNHPRDVHSGFTPFAPRNMIAATGKRLDNRRLQANGMELINSAALQSDPMPALRNWLALLNRGLPITAVGSSDSHEVSRKIVGQGRSYVYADDRKPGEIDTEQVVRCFQNGRVMTSLGLLVELTVEGKSESGDTHTVGEDEHEVTASIRVQGPQWTQAEQVQLYVNGRLYRSVEVPRERRSLAGEKMRVEWSVQLPRHDAHLVAVARGAGQLAPFWPIAKAYQPTSPEWSPYVFGASGVVRIDVDGDGFQPVRHYAQQLVKQHDKLPALLTALEGYDRSVSIFAAESWLDAGRSLDSASLEAADERVAGAFREYLQSLRRSLSAAANRDP